MFADAPAVLPVTFDPAAEAEMGGVLEVRSMRMRPLGTDWQFQLVARNLLQEKPLGMLEMKVEVSYETPATAPSRLTLMFQGANVAPQRDADLYVTTAALGKRPGAFRVTGFRRIAPGPTPRAPAVQNKLRNP